MSAAASTSMLRRKYFDCVVVCSRNLVPVNTRALRAITDR